MPFVTRYFNDLYQFPPSAKVEEFLKNFIEPKAIDEFTFIEGVKKFINIVNLNPFDESSQGRAAFYGNRYLGIHYASDLVKLWNSQHVKPELTTKGYIGDLAPQEWSYIFSEGPSCLVYRGENPAQALDQLIKGPTAIDCAMFVQLGLWFGIRYMLGNNKFNQCFGKTPFFITLLLNHDIDDVNRPLFGNPLYSFLSSPKEKTPSLIKIEYISNTPHYIYKHPGGDDSGQNCIIIQGRYYILLPAWEKPKV